MGVLTCAENVDLSHMWVLAQKVLSEGFSKCQEQLQEQRIISYSAISVGIMDTEYKFVLFKLQS